MHLFITAPLLCKIQRSLAYNSFPISYFLLPRSYWDSFVVLRDSNVCHHDYLFKYSEYENNSLIIMSPFISDSFLLTYSIFWFVVIYNFSKQLNIIKHNNAFSTSLCVMTGSFWFCMAIYHAETWQDSIELVFIWDAPKTQQTTGNLCQQFLIRHPLWYQCKIFINPSSPGQRGRHFKDDIFRCIFVNEKSCILNKFPKGPIYNNPALVYKMAWPRICEKPLSELMLTRFSDAYVRQLGEMSFEHLHPYLLVPQYVPGRSTWFFCFHVVEWIIRSPLQHGIPTLCENDWDLYVKEIISTH